MTRPSLRAYKISLLKGLQLFLYRVYFAYAICCRIQCTPSKRCSFFEENCYIEATIPQMRRVSMKKKQSESHTSSNFLQKTSVTTGVHRPVNRSMNRSLSQNSLCRVTLPPCLQSIVTKKVSTTTMAYWIMIFGFNILSTKQNLLFYLSYLHHYLISELGKIWPLEFRGKSS